MSFLGKKALQFRRNELDSAVARLTAHQQERMKSIFPEGVKEDDVGSAYAYIEGRR